MNLIDEFQNNDIQKKRGQIFKKKVFVFAKLTCGPNNVNDVRLSQLHLSFCIYLQNVMSQHP
jgi:hypothetical protein